MTNSTFKLNTIITRVINYYLMRGRIDVPANKRAELVI